MIYIICICCLCYRSKVYFFSSKWHVWQTSASNPKLLFCVCRLHKMRVWLSGSFLTLQPGETWKHIGHPLWSDLLWELKRNTKYHLTFGKLTSKSWERVHVFVSYSIFFCSSTVVISLHSYWTNPCSGFSIPTKNHKPKWKCSLSSHWWWTWPFTGTTAKECVWPL